MIITKNWKTFQHYSDRSPPWIKLYRTLLDDCDFMCLPIASKALAPMLWLVASERIDGKIDATMKQLAFRVRMADVDFLAAFKPLVDNGFFICDSDVLAGCKRDASTVLSPRLQHAPPETESESETETEKKEIEVAAQSADAPSPYKPTKSKKRVAGKKAPLPEDWVPHEGTALSLVGRLELDKMRDWARSNAILKADWDATYRNWMRRVGEFNQRGGSNGSGQGRSVLAAADRLIDRLGGPEAARAYVPGSADGSYAVDSNDGSPGFKLIPPR